MEYILGKLCPHPSHEDEDECRGIAYLYDEFGSLLVFSTKKDALDFVKDNRWSPQNILIIPKKEAILDDEQLPL